MKKFLIFLAIIYFANSIEICESTSAPASAEECIGKDVANEDNTCCYFLSPNKDVSKCYELPKNETEREAYIRQKYPAFRTYTYDCFSNFLTISLLFIGILMVL